MFIFSEKTYKWKQEAKENSEINKIKSEFAVIIGHDRPCNRSY